MIRICASSLPIHMSFACAPILRLRSAKSMCLQSRELARIRLDLDVDLDLDQIKARPPDRAAAYELFKELEFSALTREFADAATATTPSVDGSLNYQLINSRAGLDSL